MTDTQLQPNTSKTETCVMAMKALMESLDILCGDRSSKYMS